MRNCTSKTLAVVAAAVVGFVVGRVQLSKSQGRISQTAHPPARFALDLKSPITVVEWVDHRTPNQLPQRFRVVRWISPVEGVPPPRSGPPDRGVVISLLDDVGLVHAFQCEP